MKRFRCPGCAGEVYFENTVCLSCNRALVYDPVAVAMTDGTGRSGCLNRATIGCNWVAGSATGFCISCALTEVVPDLSIALNVARWKKIEHAKRRLIYSVLRLGLPVETDAGRRLQFRFLASVPHPDGSENRVMTGHDNGIITLSVSEADDDVREATRVAMGEPYRTLLGHFRHESGHFYWDVLVADAGRDTALRDVFGDHQQDYAAALQRHYSLGAPPDWDQKHVTSYASAHPWEDFAETWAHMLHILDGLETAAEYGIGNGSGTDAYDRPGDAAVLADWLPVSLAMNAMTRSMGHPDFYPFQTPPAVAQKLDVVMRLVHDDTPVGTASRSAAE